MVFKLDMRRAMKYLNDLFFGENDVNYRVRFTKLTGGFRGGYR